MRAIAMQKKRMKKERQKPVCKKEDQYCGQNYPPDIWVFALYIINTGIIFQEFFL